MCHIILQHIYKHGLKKKSQRNAASVFNAYSVVGVRYFMRGVNNEGHVANFVETEQIIFLKQCKASIVQVCVCSLCNRYL